MEKNETSVVTPRKKPGRPKKNEVATKQRGGRGVRGRPKGDATIINEYKARMLASPKSRKVLDAIFDAALDNEHKNQAAAWKLIIDRVAPLSAFEQEITKSGGRPSISINISGIGGDVSVSGDNDDGMSNMSDIIDGEIVSDES